MAEHFSAAHASPRELAVTLLRVFVTVVGLFVIYFAFPLSDRENAAIGLVSVMAALTVFALIFWRQLRRIRSAEFPLLRAAEAIVVVATLFIILMASIATAFSTSDSSNYSEPLSRLDAVYFTVTTLATVGFGDITPTAPVTRAFTTFQIVLGVGLLGAGLRSLVNVAQQVAQTRSPDQRS